MSIKFSMVGLFCLVGCLYQIYDITELLAQFKVRHDVAYDYATNVELPAIDITEPMVMAMNLTELFAAYPDEMNLICGRLNIDDERSNYTTNVFSYNFYKTCFTHFKQAPIDYSHELAGFIKVKDIRNLTFINNLDSLQIYLPSFGNLTERHCKFTRYYSGVAIYTRIFCLNETKPFSVNTNFVSLNEGVISTLKYIKVPYFGIRFSDPTDLPVYDQSKYYMISRQPGFKTLTSINFVKTVMSSLEYPYETSCHRYNKAKSLSKCLTEYSLGQPTPYLIDALIYEWNEHPEHLGFDPRKNAQRVNDKIIDRKDEHNAIIFCGQQSTATECEKTSYLVEGKTSNEAKGDYGIINIESSRKANIYLSAHPDIPWSEFIIFIGSILGIWFGIPIYDYIFKLLTCIRTRIIERVLKQTKTKRITNQTEIEINDN